MPSVLYVSYDGMLEPLGQSQVLSYLENMTDDYQIRIISFEKPEDRRDGDKIRSLKDRLSQSGVKWTPLTYHKKPSSLATAWDILIGTLVVLWFTLTERAVILHARSYVPALMVLLSKKLTRAKFLFDIRGFWADERVDGGIWPRDSRVYKVTKSLERRFFKAADYVVTLTHASEKIIREFDYLKDAPPPMSVIPTCADLERFQRHTVDPDRPFTFGYVGSIGTWYLFDETLAFFKALLKVEPDAHFLIVNRHEHALIYELADKHGIAHSRLTVGGAEHKDVPAKVSQMHAAAALIRPCFSKLSSAPTKLAEYLGCGVPCLGNIGVGDMEDTLEHKGGGIALKDFSEDSLASAADMLVKLARNPETSTRCRNIATELFSLESGVAEYRRIYKRLTTT